MSEAVLMGENRVRHQFDVRHEAGLVVEMADGTKLVADAWYPDDGLLHPVLMQRLPYGRLVASASVLPSPLQLARRGYAVVVQDVRGRGDSEGEFVPFLNEVADGVTSTEWAANLPFSDGRVILYGFSYQGTMQLGIAARRPKGLAAIAPMMCAAEPYEMVYEGGCLMWEASARWAAQLATAEDDAQRREARLDARPILSAIGSDAPRWYVDWVEHDKRDAYWTDLAADLAAVEVPVFTIVGYADTFAAQTARLARRTGATVVLGPWSHMPWGSRLGSLELAGATPTVAYDAMFEFLESVLGSSARPLVGARYFVIGAGWHEAEQFPPAGSELVLHAVSFEGANSRHGDGSLATTAPGRDLDDMIVAEPLVPHPGSLEPYPDVSAAEDRRDVLCYTGEPAAASFELVGQPAVRATVVTEASDFDVVAWVTCLSGEVSRRLAVGARRVTRHRGGAADVEVELGPVAWLVESGMQLRLHVAASCYPLFLANPQSCTPPAKARRADHRVALIELRSASVSVTVCGG